MTRILLAIVLTAVVAGILLARRQVADVPHASTTASPGPRLHHVINNPHGPGVVPAALIPGTGRGYFVAVHGESHYQETLRDLRQKLERDLETSVILSPEPENEHDPNAVAVQTFKGETVGYLTREDAPRYQPTLLELRRRGLTSICSARLYGGTKGKPHIGLWLDIEAPTAVAAAFEVAYKRVRSEKRNPVVEST